MPTIATGDKRWVIRFRQLINVETLSAAKTLNPASPRIQKLDANGSNRDVTLFANPAPGEYFEIINGSSGATNLVVKNSAGSTLATLNQNEEGLFVANSSGAFVLACVRTIALS